MKKKFIVPVVALALGTSSLAGCKQSPAKPKAPTLSSLKFDTTSVQMEYVYEATAVSLDGLKVYAVYSDESEVEVSDYDYVQSDLAITNEDRAGAKLGQKKKVKITYQTKSKNLEFTIKPEVVDWKEEEKTLMTSNLLGVALPFNRALKNKTYTVEWDATEETLYIDAEGTYDQDSLTAYKATFLSTEGWQTSTQTYGNGKIVNFQKEVAREGEAPAVVTGAFSVVDRTTGAPAESGDFDLYARVEEPYVKDWPAATALDYSKKYSSDADPDVLPAATADYYEIYSEADQGFDAIIGYTSTDPQYAPAGWGTGLLDPSGFQQYISPKENYAVWYKFNEASKYFVVQFDNYYKPATEWPAEQIAALVDDFASQDSIPAWNGEASEYMVNTDAMQIRVTMPEGTTTEQLSAAATAYNAFLVSDGHYAQRTKANGYVSEHYELSAYAVASNGYVFIILNAVQPNDLFKSKGFFGQGSTELLPEALGINNLADYASFYANQAGTDYDYEAPFIKFYAEDVATKVAELQNTLLNNGYFLSYVDEYNDNHYYSPAQELDICVWASSADARLDIIHVDSEDKLSTSESFPAEEVAAFLGEGHASVPALSGASNYLYSDSETSFEVLARFENAEAAATALATYGSGLSDYTAKGENVFVSNDGSVTLTLSTNGSYVSIVVTDSAVFPLAGINAFLDEEFTDEQVPVIEKADGIQFSSSQDEATGVYTVSVTYAAGAEAASAAKTAYEAALVEKGFAEVTAGSGVYGNTSLALKVEVSVEGDVLTIKFSSILVNAISSTFINEQAKLTFSHLPSVLVKSKYSVSNVTFNDGSFGVKIVANDDYSSVGAVVSDAFGSDTDNWNYRGTDSSYKTWYVCDQFHNVHVAIYAGYDSSSNICVFIRFYVYSVAQEALKTLGKTIPEFDESTALNKYVMDYTLYNYKLVDTMVLYQNQASAQAAYDAYMLLLTATEGYTVIDADKGLYTNTALGEDYGIIVKVTEDDGDYYVEITVGLLSLLQA